MRDRDEIPIIKGSALAAMESEGRDDEACKSIDELMAAVDDYFPLPERDVDRPFLMPVEDVFSIKGRGTVGTGRVDRGVIRVGDEVEIVGLAKEVRKTVCTGVEMFNKTLDDGQAGDNVGFLSVENLRLAGLGSESARELIQFLCQNALNALHTCQLTVDKQPVVDLNASCPKEVIEQPGEVKAGVEYTVSTESNLETPPLTMRELERVVDRLREISDEFGTAAARAAALGVAHHELSRRYRCQRYGDPRWYSHDPVGYCTPSRGARLTSNDPGLDALGWVVRDPYLGQEMRLEYRDQMGELPPRDE